MLLGNHVFDVEGEEIVIVLVQPAVVTATARPLPDKGPERRIHHSPAVLARSWRPST